MPVSQSSFNVFMKLFSAFRLKFAATHAGRQLELEQIDLPEGVSQEAFQSVMDEFVQTLRDRTKKLEQEKVATAERKRQARETESARIIAAESENQRQSRFHAFLAAEDKPQPFAKLPEGAFVIRHRGGALAAVRDEKLPFLGVFIQEGTKFYAFENVGNLDRCERCTAPLKSVGGGMTTTTFSCTGCGDVTHRAKVIESRSKMNPSAYSLVG